MTDRSPFAFTVCIVTSQILYDCGIKLSKSHLFMLTTTSYRGLGVYCIVDKSVKITG